MVLKDTFSDGKKLISMRTKIKIVRKDVRLNNPIVKNKKELYIYNFYLQ
jgi:hypothetical protein